MTCFPSQNTAQCNIGHLQKAWTQLKPKWVRPTLKNCDLPTDAVDNLSQSIRLELLEVSKKMSDTVYGLNHLINMSEMQFFRAYTMSWAHSRLTLIRYPCNWIRRQWEESQQPLDRWLIRGNKPYIHWKTNWLLLPVRLYHEESISLCLRPTAVTNKWEQYWCIGILKNQRIW